MDQVHGQVFLKGAIFQQVVTKIGLFTRSRFMVRD